MREAVLVHPLYEVPQHLLRDVEVGDDTILERPDGTDRPRRPAEHALRLDPHRVDLAAAGIDGDHRRLGEDDAAPADVDQRVCGPEVDGHVAAAKAGQVAEDAHW